MIFLRLKDGMEAALAPEHPMSLGGKPFPVSALSRIVLDGMLFGGRDHIENGVERRDLVFTDPETGIQVVVTMTMAEAREVGEHLQKVGGIMLAKDLGRLR